MKKEKMIMRDKIRFAEDLRNSFVTVEGREVKVLTLNGEVFLRANEDEDINALRNKVYAMVKGTPCNVESVSTLVELCL